MFMAVQRIDNDCLETVYSLVDVHYIEPLMLFYLELELFKCVF